MSVDEPAEPRAAPPQVHPVADLFPLMNDAEIDDLAADIAEHGQREPVWVHRDGRIIDGRNRWRACLLAGREPVTRTYQGEDVGLVAFVVSLNLKRRHLNESQRSMVTARVATLQQGDNQWSRQLAGPTQAEAAALLNVSERSAQRARVVQEQGVPELSQAVDRGGVAVSTAAVVAREPAEVQREVVQLDDREIIRRAKEIQQRQRDDRLREKALRVAEIAARRAEPLINLGPFPVLYVDPPWRYEYAETSIRQVENQYPTMSLDEIKALDLPAADNAVIFMWVTSPKLLEGLEVLDAWEFDYRTCMVWVKDRIGMGYYARQQHELLLVAKRGNLPVPDPEDRPSSVIAAPRGEHSAKPDTVYELIERMYPLRDRCELFQRRPRNGWAGWGNQA